MRSRAVGTTFFKFRNSNGAAGSILQSRNFYPFAFISVYLKICWALEFYNFLFPKDYKFNEFRVVRTRLSSLIFWRNHTSDVIWITLDYQSRLRMRKEEQKRVHLFQK